MTPTAPPWPATRTAVVMELEKLTRGLIEAYHDDLDPLQEMARRLALTNITAARDTLCIAADPRDRGHERRASPS